MRQKNFAFPIKAVQIACLLMSCNGFAVAQDKPLAIFSYSETSCGTWSRSAGKEGIRAQYVSWFRGFVSGYNFGNPDNQVSMGQMPDAETLYLYIDKYCRENPLNPFISAAFKLVEELRQSPSTPPRKLKP